MRMLRVQTGLENLQGLLQMLPRLGNPAPLSAEHTEIVQRQADIPMLGPEAALLDQQGAPVLRGNGSLTNALIKALPFALTKAQEHAYGEICTDLNQSYPMQRLLQGDVGSGKTIVAALAACQAIEAGYQVAFMAPTELLAEQHYNKLVSWLAPLGIKIAWLSGSQKKSERQAHLSAAASDAHLVVGTHALFEDTVDFSKLGLVITLFIAAGVGAFEPRTLKIEGLGRYHGTQVLHRAGELSLQPTQHLVIVGGGEDAVQAALHFAEPGAQRAASVTLVHRRDVFQAAPEALARMRALSDSGHLQLAIGQVIGLEEQDGRLTSLTLAGAAVIDLPMDVLFGKAPKMLRQAERHRPQAGAALDLATLDPLATLLNVLRFPTVASKQFLITIGDRTVGGLSHRDQMVGPWQTPVADVAVTLADFTGYTGEAMCIAERTPLATEPREGKTCSCRAGVQRLQRSA